MMGRERTILFHIITILVYHEKRVHNSIIPDENSNEFILF